MMQPRVIEKLNYLKGQRWPFLRSIFSPLAKRGKYIQVHSVSLGGNFIIGISDGPEAGTSFMDWRFQTLNDSIRACYFEVWVNLGKDKYFLEKSYLHLYHFENVDLEKEYVLLHCDPSEPDETPHSIYKQSPHIHIEVAPHPLPKSHIALYNGMLIDILKDLKSFDKALKQSVEMIHSQIISIE